MTFGETWKTAAYGGFADAIGGVATIVPATLGLSGLSANLLHVAAALFHALVRGDCVFDVTMKVAPATSLWRRRL
jgi:cytochrome b561